MITVRFFARVRESLECDERALDWEPGLDTVQSVQHRLCELGGDTWQRVLNEDNMIRCVNHKVVTMDQPVSDGDELAFFPPVTGG